MQKNSTLAGKPSPPATGSNRSALPPFPGRINNAHVKRLGRSFVLSNGKHFSYAETLEGSICSICREAQAVAFDGYWDGDPKRNAIFTCSDCVHPLANLIAKAVAASPGDFRGPLEETIYRITREAYLARAVAPDPT